MLVEESLFGDNSTIMLLNLLKKVNVGKIRIAGFDGLECNRNNYVDMPFMDRNNIMDLKQTNDEIRKLYLTFKD